MPLPHIPHVQYIWLLAASTMAGVMNAMAGGGSFLSFPAMLRMGVPPVQANATNTVALWPGQLTSLATLRGDVHARLLPTVALTCGIGGVNGDVLRAVVATGCVVAGYFFWRNAHP